MTAGRRGLSATRFRHREGEFVVFSFDAPGTEEVAGLSSAERDVAERALRGHSNQRIASDRGASVRTVANQIAAVFRKVGVRSRTELAAKLRGVLPSR